METRCQSRGFTLIELMITVVIVGILAVVAVPSYLDQVRKGRRADAFDAMVLVQQQQERFRSQNTRYAASFEALGLGQTFRSAAGHYGLALTDVTGFGYVLTATAAGRQASDAQCATFRLVVNKGSNERTARNSGGTDTTSKCWPQ